MSSEKPCSEAPKQAVADADGGRPHPPPAPPTPEPSCPPPDDAPAPSALPPHPPATGAAPKIPSAPNSSAQQAAAAAPDCRSFSQLLAGAMASPAGSPRSSAPILAVPVDAVRVPVVAVPCFLAPAAALLESPRFTGQFAMTHQEVLATVTAQAQMQQMQPAHPSSSDTAMSSFPQPILSTISPVPLQQRPPDLPEDNVRTPEVEQVHSSDQKPQSAQIVVDTNSGGDGYNWRKYGQKQVKSSENSRSYYKCTNGNCFAKKKVERCPDGRITEVMYRGQHNHDPPQQTRYSRERRVRSSWPLILGESESVDLPSSEINESDPSTSKTDQNSGNETPDQQFFCSSDCEGDTGIKTEDDLGDEPDPKRRLSESTMTCSAPPFKVTREPKIVVQAASDVGQVSDGYRWRKYGQKFVKGNPNPRSYYRCTHSGCPVRKHVERASDDVKSIVMTYEGKHNHELPGPKNTNDPPASPRPVAAAAAAAVAPDEQLHTSKSSLDHKPPTKSQPELDGESTGEKASELGGEKALESAQALLSIGFNSSAERSMAEPIPRA